MYIHEQLDINRPDLVRKMFSREDRVLIWKHREEEISLDPPIAVFHEFLSEGEMR